MAPYGRRTEPKKRLGDVNIVIFVCTGFIKAYKVLQAGSYMQSGTGDNLIHSKYEGSLSLFFAIAGL